ncbi:MAG: RadC family protein [Saprospiraceae bacterium]|jgi:DNA repair protein RadC
MKQYEEPIVFGIKNWAEEDRPREKLLLKGKHNLSDSELLAILLGSGSRNESAVDLAKRILQQVDGDLGKLARLNVSQFKTFKGVGNVKAITLIAALELGKRRMSEPTTAQKQIVDSASAYRELVAHLTDLEHEEFWILLLNRANKVMRKERISIGGVAGTYVDAKIIFRKALEISASGLILYHNHPSGNLKPSQADIDLTKKVCSGAQGLDLKIIDHLIIGDRQYYSFKDNGLID